MATLVEDAGEVPAASRGSAALAGGWLPPRLRSRLKRGLDVVGAVVLLVVTSPLLLLAAVAIRLAGPGPVFFAHRRVGRGGRPFRCWKLRTMRLDSEAALAAHLAACPEAAREWECHRKLRNDPRVLGPVGRLLRRTSLDELPQLLNVITGEMSLVGPRPVVADELPRYGAHLGWYLAVRPGLTGPWQVGDRSDASYGERVRIDVGYARRPSLRRDLGILVRTLAVPFEQRGAR